MDIPTEIKPVEYVAFTISGIEPSKNENMTMALGKRNLILKNALVITDAGDQYGAKYQGSVMLQLGNIVNSNNVIDNKPDLNYFQVNLDYNIKETPTAGNYSNVSLTYPNVGVTIKSPVEQYMKFSIRNENTGALLSASDIQYYSFQFQAF